MKAVKKLSAKGIYFKMVDEPVPSRAGKFPRRFNKVNTPSLQSLISYAGLILFKKQWIVKMKGSGYW